MIKVFNLLASELPSISSETFWICVKVVVSGFALIGLIAFVIFALKDTKFMQPGKEEFDENKTLQQVKKPQGKVEISEEYKKAMEKRRAIEQRAFEEEYRRAIREGRYEKKSLLDVGKDIKNRVNRADRSERQERQERENRK